MDTSTSESTKLSEEEIKKLALEVYENHSPDLDFGGATGKSVDVESIEGFIASVVLMHGVDIKESPHQLLYMKANNIISKPIKLDQITHLKCHLV